MSSTVNSKDALFMLDTDIEQDMSSYKDEVTGMAIKYINSTPELYSRIKQSNNYADEANMWAEEHDDEFGSLFISELDMVDWNTVKERV